MSATAAGTPPGFLGDRPMAPPERDLGPPGPCSFATVAPDTAPCAECAAEIADAFARRYRYPFATCPACGPRFSLLPGTGRAGASRARSACADCQRQQADTHDRRYAFPDVSCHACGPRARLVRTDGAATSFDRYSMLDDVDAVATLLQRGEIVAVGSDRGPLRLWCDATHAVAVARLCASATTRGEPAELVARDLEVLLRWVAADALERRALSSPANPIVKLRARPAGEAARPIQPGARDLGFRLPGSALEHLLLKRVDRPILVAGAGRLACPLRGRVGLARLAPFASHALLHDQATPHPIDPSVVRVALGEARVLRRARGLAPASLRLPAGFEAAAGVVAFGAERGATWCLLEGGEALLSHWHGDLRRADARERYRASLAEARRLCGSRPQRVAGEVPIDRRRRPGQRGAVFDGLPKLAVQHHHAHVCACLVEHEMPLDAAPVLGVALDGLATGDDGTLWGGELLLADYRRFRRVGTFKPVVAPGGRRALYEPWRNTYAHLMAELGWARLAASYDQLDLFRFFEAKPQPLRERMLAPETNPRASSCGLLLDAVAAAIDIRRERVQLEGQAWRELEAIADERALEEDESLVYPFSIPNLGGGNGLPYVEPHGAWQAILGDLVLGTSPAVIAGRFHRALARVVARLVGQVLEPLLAADVAQPVVVLTGDCFENRLLLEQVATALTGRALAGRELRVLTHSRVPASDGGVALGQAAIAAAASLPVRRQAGSRRLTALC